MKRKLSLVLMLVLMILLLAPFEALAQEIVYSSITAHNAGTSCPYLRKSWYDGGYWTTWNQGGTVYYSYSLTGVTGTWTAPATLIASLLFDGGQEYSIWYDEARDYLHLIADTHVYNWSVTYRMGRPNPTTHSIDWVAAEQVIQNLPSGLSKYTSSAGSGYSVCVDTDGYPWFAYENGNYDIGIFGSSTQDGTFTIDAAKTKVYAGSFDSASLLPLTSAKVAVVYRTTSGGKFNVARWNGAWATVASTTTGSSSSNYSAVSQSDTVHLAWLDSSADIRYAAWQYNSFGAETVLMAGAESDVAPTISMDTDANDLHVFWKDEPTDEHVYYAYYNSVETTWYVGYDLIDESAGSHTDADKSSTIGSEIITDRDHLAVYYQAGTTNTMLKFKLLDEALDVATLVPDPIGATTATLRGEILSLGFGSATERGFWINDTPSLSGATQEGNETGTFNVGVFTHGVTGLTEGDSYYVIAYASNDYGEDYGWWYKFTTGGEGSDIVVQTLDPTNMGDTHATFNGNLLSAPSGCTLLGFEYGMTEVATYETTQGGNFALGVYAMNVTDLEADSLYYVRAIAGNDTAEDHGAWIGFITEQPSYVPGEGDTYADLITAPIPTTAPGGWIRPGKDYNGFPIISPLINTFADLGFGRSFFWFVVEVFCIIVLTLIGARFTKNLPITFGILLVLFLLPFIAFEYLDWWMLAPFLVVGGALCIKEGQFSWS